MSGPKDYSPPPRYSMQVFDGKLNQVFQMQSRLKMLCSEIEGLHVSDSKLNIQFDCKNELSKIRKQIDKLQKALVFDYKGTFGQDTYNRISSEIDLRISELLKAVNECELIKKDFAGKKSDYNSFLSYLIFYDNSNISFDEFKSQIIHYLKTSVESNAPEIFKEADKKISSIEFTKNKAKFGFGFNSKIDSKIQLTKKRDNKISDESKTISEKIKSLIRNCDDATMRKKYKVEFEKLSESESLKDNYFFKELHDSIFDTEKTRKAKVEIQKMSLMKSNSNLNN